MRSFLSQTNRFFNPPLKSGRNRIARQVLLYRLPQRNYSISFDCELWIGSNLFFNAQGGGQVELTVHVGVHELDRIIR
jgi:hypothetical protein